jgi:hypothetical protein
VSESHFGWLACVRQVSQSFFMQHDGDKKKMYLCGNDFAKSKSFFGLDWCRREVVPVIVMTRK